MNPSTPSSHNAPAAANKRPASQSPDATPPNAKAIASRQTPPRPETTTPHGSTVLGKSNKPSPKSGAPAETTSPKRSPPAGPSPPTNATNVAPRAVSPPKFGGPLKPASAVPGGLIPNLVIIAKEENQETVKTKSNQRYPILEEIIHKALKVMETEAGIQRLGLVATTLIHRRNEQNESHTWGNRPFSDMSKEMKTFVKKLRDNFPPIHLRNIAEDAWTERWQWPADRDVVQVPVPDLAQFDPGECLSLELNTKVYHIIPLPQISISLKLI